MIARELTPQEKSLWSRYYQCTALLAIAGEYNAKTWPVKTATDIDAAIYISTFCYVFEEMRARQKQKVTT